MKTLRQRVSDWLFPAEPDTWLAVLRLGLGLQALLYAASLRSDWEYLLGGAGSAIVNRDLSEGILSLESPFVPRIGWLTSLGGRLGVSEGAVLSFVWAGLLCASIMLVAGLFCRATAILTWLFHLCATKSGGFVVYGVDRFMTIGLAYLMFAPLPDRYSLDRIWRRISPTRGDLIGFFRRVLQTHLSIIYFFGGLAKCLGSGWWNGSNLWRALIRPPFNVVSPDVLVKYKAILPPLGISILVIETAYPFFIWPKRTRNVWLTCVVSMHLAIGLLMGMYLFGLVMMILNLAAFGPNTRGADQDSKAAAPVS